MFALHVFPPPQRFLLGEISMYKLGSCGAFVPQCQILVALGENWELWKGHTKIYLAKLQTDRYHTQYWLQERASTKPSSKNVNFWPANSPSILHPYHFTSWYSHASWAEQASCAHRSVGQKYITAGKPGPTIHLAPGLTYHFVGEKANSPFCIVGTNISLLKRNPGGLLNQLHYVSCDMCLRTVSPFSGPEMALTKWFTKCGDPEPLVRAKENNTIRQRDILPFQRKEINSATLLLNRVSWPAFQRNKFIELHPPRLHSLFYVKTPCLSCFSRGSLTRPQHQANGFEPAFCQTTILRLFVKLQHLPAKQSKARTYLVWTGWRGFVLLIANYSPLAVVEVVEAVERGVVVVVVVAIVALLSAKLQPGQAP